MQGAIWFHCGTSSCTASYEDVVAKDNMGTINAQVEFFTTGVIELRYGTFRVPSAINYTAGIQDDSQNLRLPAPMATCSAVGLCSATSASPANSGLRFTRK
jgi:hypothetical protein